MNKLLSAPKVISSKKKENYLPLGLPFSIFLLWLHDVIFPEVGEETREV